MNRIYYAMVHILKNLVKLIICLISCFSKKVSFDTNHDTCLQENNSAYDIFSCFFIFDILNDANLMYYW
jgi:hypothetical protein